MYTTSPHGQSPIGLTDLPPEIFQRIMGFVAEGDCDYSYLGNVRLVSRLFNQEILAEIFWGGVIRQYFSRWPLAIPQEWRVRLLRDLVMTKRHSTKNTFLLQIRDVVNAVLDYKHDRSDQVVMDLSTAVCSLAVAYLSNTLPAKDLPDYFFCHKSGRLPLPTATIRGCVCVASWLGDYAMYRHFQDKQLQPLYGVTKHFGPCAWAAAYQGHVDFLKRTRDDGMRFHRHSIPMVPESALMVASLRDSNAHRDAAAVILGAMLMKRSWPTDWELSLCAAHAITLENYKVLRLLTRPDVYIKVQDRVEEGFINECTLSRAYYLPELIEFLLSHGVDPDTKAKFQHVKENGRAFEQKMLTPLQLAIGNKDNSLVALLLRHGADANFAGMKAHLAPLHMALQSQQPLIVDALLRHGACKYGPSTDREETHNLLLMPEVQSHIATFRTFLSHFHIATNAEDNHTAYSTLDRAAKTGRNDLIRALVDAGCTIHGLWDPPLKASPSPPAPTRGGHVTRRADKAVQTPLPQYHRCLTSPTMRIALQNGQQHTAELLLEMGAVWNYPYDYILRGENEAAGDVDERLKALRRKLDSRDGRIEREWKLAEEVGRKKAEAEKEAREKAEDARSRLWKP